MTLEKPIFRNRSACSDLKDLVPNPRVILDCGAGAGWFAKSAFNTWPNAIVHSFEPCSRFNLSLQPLNDRHFIHRVALDAEEGVKVLYTTHGMESNSLLEFLPNGPLCKLHNVVGQEEVECRALDDVITCGMDFVDLLKMDVQGAELRVLQGAKKLLQTARPVIYTEVSFQPLYQSHPLISTMDEYLDSLGYQRVALYESPMPDLWGDAIYVPKERVPDSEKKPEPRKVDGIRLNIGAGMTEIPGFTPIDRKFGTEAFPLNYADDSVDEIRCVHMLEHLSFKDVDAALLEWYRVLKPGGRLRLSVPDIPKVARLAQESNYNQAWRFFMYGGQTDENDFHKSGFDQYVLKAYMESVGFQDIRPWESDHDDGSSLPISLNLEGFKPKTECAVVEQLLAKPAEESKSFAPVKPCVEVEAKVRAVCGLPRTGFNDAWQSIYDAMNAMRIPIETHQGCFWWQNMQAGMVRALDDGIDWLITLDYDSMILPIHVQRLLEIMGQRPDIDALASLQMRRGKEVPLFTNGQTEIVFDGSPVKVNTAHFGLTVIRVAKLKDIPKPWLIDIPDEKGEFGGNHTDADITFWKKWTAAGNSVWVAPDVRIGHIEVLVSEFDENYRITHRHIGDWWNHHTRLGHCRRTTKGV